MIQAQIHNYPVKCLSSGLINLIFFFFLLLAFSSCSILEEFQYPVHSFKSKNIASYSIKKIALLPIVPDTKDSCGTFYSTDYFNDLLLDDYSNLQFADVQDLRQYDFNFLSDMIDDIKKNNLLDYKTFLNTDLGDALRGWNCDAIFIGTVDSVRRDIGWMTAYNYLGINKGRKTECFFSYYLVSLKNGRIIWKASVKGAAIYSGKTVSTRINSITGTGYIYPPIDEAIAGGIELMAEEFPAEIFKRSKIFVF